MRPARALLPILLACAVGTSAAAVPLDPRPPQAVESDPLLDMGSSEPVDPALVDALRLLNQGRFAEAAAEARGALARRPDSAVGQEILGAALAKQGELEAAQQALERAVSLEPSGLTAWRKLGNVQLARGDEEGARASFQRVLELDPGDRIAHQRLGMIAQGQGRLREAVSQYEQGILGTPPGYLGVKLDLARLYNAAGRYGDSIRLLAPLSSQAQTNAALASVLGSAYLESGDTQAALGYLRRLVELRPGEAAAAYLLATAERRASDLDAALDQAQRASSLEPTWAPAHLLEGEILLELGRPAEALAPLELAAALSEDPSLPRLRAASAHAMLGDRVGARALLAQLVQAKTGLAAAYVGLGRLEQQDGNLEAARAAFAAGLERLPDDADLLIAAGSFHGFVKEYDQAVLLLQRALARRPGDAEALRALAWSCARSGRPEQARQAARLLTQQQSGVESQLLLADVLRETGASVEAAALYEEILAGQPQQVMALANLSLIRAEQERWDEARSLARRAASLAPADAPLQRRLAPILGDAPAPD